LLRHEDEKKMIKLKRTLEQALGEGGRILKKGFYRPKKIRHKGPKNAPDEEVNLVTETDQKAERAIIRIIRKQFPDHDILAEESHEGKSLADVRRGRVKRWIIDPVDGTTNFAHGLPLSCVSIGYEENGSMKLGGVFNPVLGEWFWAERGKGASLNGKRIHVSKTRKLMSSLLVTGFPYDRRNKVKYYLKMFEAFMVKTHGVRRLGSAALDLCYVACGRFEGFWELGLKPWDVAAGTLIAREAGARLSDFKGKPIDIYQPQTLATNGKIHAEVLRIIKRHI
jgi:myo-inositol-1(or 4)-monophosphatase